MKTGVILVQKFNMDVVNFELVEAFHKKVKETLPVNIKAVVIPHTWELKQVEDKVIYIGIDSFTDVRVAVSIVDKVAEDLGEEYVIVSNICKSEVISEKH